MAKWKTGRVDRMRFKGDKDPYRLAEKPPGGAVCKDCGATVVDGRWTWSAPSGEVVSTVCPACRRIRDNYPAGYLTLDGPFFTENREEIMNLVSNVAEAEKGEHPLERVMAMENDGGTTGITTTGVHLARRLGDSVQRSYRGELTVHYEEGENRVRVNWAR
ncbi:MAG: BCAM0308 family protein [bacterium]|nr:BCAM0308 family protein [bacterium]MDT8366521.1 BCAM0308 family protein [bacterium]